MTYFSKTVNLDSRDEMIGFLKGHFRYSTANSFNYKSSYANCIKLYKLGLTKEQEDKLFDIIYCDGAYDEINLLIDDFEYAHDYNWQVGFNGRSNGYLVLYKGEYRRSEWKSFCRSCCQKNFSSIEETGC